jgi:hypothetical protein
MSSSEAIVPDKLYTLRDVMALEGTSHGELYRRINRGQYAPVIKDGRSTKILGRGIIERRAAALRPLRTPALDALSRSG